jgi:hypothetical protein
MASDVNQADAAAAESYKNAMVDGMDRAAASIWRWRGCARSIRMRPNSN